MHPEALLLLEGAACAAHLLQLHEAQQPWCHCFLFFFPACYEWGKNATNSGACETSVTVCGCGEEQQGRKTKLMNWKHYGRYIFNSNLLQDIGN